MKLFTDVIFHTNDRGCNTLIVTLRKMKLFCGEGAVFKGPYIN